MDIIKELNAKWYYNKKIGIDCLSVTKINAIRFYGSGKWKELSDYEKVKYQLLVGKLFMPFDDFYAALQRELGRNVQTVELQSKNVASLLLELDKRISPPDLNAILELVGKKKVIVIGK